MGAGEVGAVHRCAVAGCASCERSFGPDDSREPTEPRRPGSANASSTGRGGLIWLVMGIRDAGPRDVDRYSVDVIVLDGSAGGRASYYARQYWRVGASFLTDPAYLLAPGVVVDMRTNGAAPAGAAESEQ